MSAEIRERSADGLHNVNKVLRGLLQKIEGNLISEVHRSETSPRQDTEVRPEPWAIVSQRRTTIIRADAYDDTIRDEYGAEVTSEKSVLAQSERGSPRAASSDIT